MCDSLDCLFGTELQVFILGKYNSQAQGLVEDTSQMIAGLLGFDVSGIWVRLGICIWEHSLSRKRSAHWEQVAITMG